MDKSKSYPQSPHAPLGYQDRVLLARRVAIPSNRDGQLEAVKEYAHLKESVSNDLGRLLTDFTQQTIPASTFEARMKATLRGVYPRAFSLGMHAAGWPRGAEPPVDAQFLEGFKNTEWGFLRSFVADMAAGRGRMSYAQRLGLYLNTIDAVHTAGKMHAQPLGTTIRWHMQAVFEHCPDCVKWALGGPYTAENIPAIPRDGTSKCKSNCKCYLEFIPPSFTTFHAPVLPPPHEIPQQLDPGRERREAAARDAMMVLPSGPSLRLRIVPPRAKPTRPLFDLAAFEREQDRQQAAVTQQPGLLARVKNMILSRFLVRSVDLSRGGLMKGRRVKAYDRTDAQGQLIHVGEHQDRRESAISPMPLSPDKKIISEKIKNKINQSVNRRGNYHLSTPIGKSDMLARDLAHEQGFDALPEQVENLDAHIQSGDIELFRGLAGKKATQYADDLRGGPLYVGFGGQSNGIYAATGEGAREIAAEYAGPHGAITRMALKKESRTIDFDTINLDRQKEHTRLRNEGSIDNHILNAVYGDTGRYGILKGYDAITNANGPGEIIVLNRGALLIEKLPALLPLGKSRRLVLVCSEMNKARRVKAYDRTDAQGQLIHVGEHQDRRPVDDLPLFSIKKREEEIAMLLLACTLTKARIPVKQYTRRGPGGQMVMVPAYEQDRQLALPLGHEKLTLQRQPLVFGAHMKKPAVAPPHQEQPGLWLMADRAAAPKTSQEVNMFSRLTGEQESARVPPESKKQEDRKMEVEKKPFHETEQLVEVEIADPRYEQQASPSQQLAATHKEGNAPQPTKEQQKGTLALEQFDNDGKRRIRVIVRGNVGAEGRAKLDVLGMTPVINISNVREKFVTTPEELDALRNALVSQGIVEGPAEKQSQATSSPSQQLAAASKDQQVEEKQSSKRIGIGTTTGNYIVHFPYDADLVAAMKRIPGARYQASVKNWMVPKTEKARLEVFAEKHGFTGMGGEKKVALSQSTGVSHTTRYGNTYSKEEWAYHQGSYGIEKENEVGMSKKQEEVRQRAKKILLDGGINESNANKLMQAIERGEIDDLIESGQLKFSLLERKTATEQARDLYYKEIKRLDRERGESEEAQKEALASRLGVR